MVGLGRHAPHLVGDRWAAIQEDQLPRLLHVGIAREALVVRLHEVAPQRLVLAPLALVGHVLTPPLLVVEADSTWRRPSTSEMTDRMNSAGSVAIVRAPYGNSA